MAVFASLNRTHWIFDMDGTLTIAAHDFDAIRAELGLPVGKPILESLAGLPAGEADALSARLDKIELEIARRSRPQVGACALLQTLSASGARLGIVTRNSKRNALETLSAVGLAEFFEVDHIVDRHAAAPKPSPDGINRLLALWGAKPDDAVVVGDYVFDLMAGKSAGTATVLLDGSGAFEHAAYADEMFEDLEGLLSALSNRAPW